MIYPSGKRHLHLSPMPLIMADELQKILDKAQKRVDDPKDGDMVNVAAFKHLREALKVLND